ncbi:MAG: TonB-dependent receptor [Chitinophagia bacterium]|jgi:iron complex outermembrane receptor protein|nr:TonB-dependent receptor [Chitinophagia bacterium]
MTKLLGTIVSFFMLANIMAQQPKQTLQKLSISDSLKKYTDSIRNLPPLEVKSIRVSETSPFAKTNFSKEAIAKVNLGQDLPFLVQNTPSVVVHSDAGTGVGYTGIRIRGTDGTRINVTLNGIPYNDAESSMTYFVDLPDFSSSVNSIQIQRGVGTSTNGAGAFGATMNLSTNSYNPSPYLSLNNSVGSFNSLKNNLVVGSGLLKNHFTIDGRVSRISSDGYMDRASSNLNSFHISGAYWGDNSSLRLNVFSGKEKTYQSWYGVPEEVLITNRTYNAAGMEKADAAYPDQTDNYTQTHYQLFYNKQINNYLKWSTALFLTKGNGYYEEYKASVDIKEYLLPANPLYNSINPDIIRRRWLGNKFYGQIASLMYEKGKNELTIGGGWNQYDGEHFGILPYPNVIAIKSPIEYYRNNASKKDYTFYTKWQYKLTTQLKSFLDLQYRKVKHQMNGFDKSPNLITKGDFDFFNPKAGLNYTLNNTSFYTSIAIAHKEPNRDDFETGALQKPTQEILYDWETGIQQKNSQFSWGMNFYHMNYKDQLVLTGKINDVGAYTRTNVPKSYRAGIELEGTWKLNSQINTSGNITFSKNKIAHFTEYFDNYDTYEQKAIEHHNTDIALSPNTTASHSINFSPNSNWQFIFTSKYVSKQYLDNTQNESRILNSYFINDLNLIWKFASKKRWDANLQFYLINLFDKLYEPNGYTYSYIYGGVTTTSNNYYPMAGRNFWLSLKIDIK